MIEDIVSYLFLNIDEKSRFHLIEEKIIHYCMEEKRILECFRILKCLEIELVDTLNNCEENIQAIIGKSLKVLNTELEIIRMKLRISHSLQDLGETQETKDIPRLRWTDTKTDLVELIYAIRSSIDGGEATMKKITCCFEYLFQIDLGNIYDTMNEISLRKVERTRYITKMMGNFNKILEKMDT